MGKQLPVRIDRADQTDAHKRYVLMVLPKLAVWEESVEDDLQTADISAEKQILKSLRKLEKKLPGRPLRAISYHLVPRRGDETDINLWLRHTRLPVSRTRAGVHHTTLRDSGSPEQRADLEISHFVGVEITDDGQGWGPGRGVTSAVIGLRPELLPYLLHDLAIDITMFHAWPGLARYMGGTANAITFSRMKVGLVRARGITECFYGAISADAEYISFAAAARRADGIDYDLYIELWMDFIEEWARVIDVPVPRLGALPTVADEIALSAGRIAKQISPRWINRAVENLYPGSYRLLIARKRPHQEEVRDALAQFFARKRYRQNMVRIIHEYDYSPVGFPMIFRPYVTVIPFVIPEIRELNEDV